MPELFVFKAGNYGKDMDWPIERVQKMVDAYDPENNYEAPAVIGHRMFALRDSDQYAHGWVSAVRMDKDGKVYATIKDFSKEARQAITEKKLRYVSVEIYEFDRLNAGDPPYLRAVALLGRDTPAVQGTRIPAMFSQIKNLVSGGIANTTDEETHIATFTRKMNVEDIKTLSEGQENTQEECMDEIEKLKARIEELDKRVKALEERAAKDEDAEESKEGSGEFSFESLKRSNAEAFYGKLRDLGKLPPAQYEKAVALDLGVGEKERKEIRAMFAALSAQVDLSGRHMADKSGAPQAPASFGASVAAKIHAYRKANKLESFGEAAKAMFAEKPELFDEEGSNA